MAVERFKNDETGYQAWLEGHPEGYVFNHFGGRDAKYNVLHRSVCSTLHRAADSGARTVYEKLCSSSRAELADAADGLRNSKGWTASGKCMGQD